MQPLLSTKPFFSCMGNHEEESEFRYGELLCRLVPWLPQHGLRSPASACRHG